MDPFRSLGQGVDTGPRPSLLILFWVAGIVITILAVGALRRRVVLDMPSDRSMHKTPTPRGGGLGIVAGFLIPAFGFVFFSPSAYILVVPLLLGAVPVAAIGWIDDKNHVAPKWRALIHLASCLVSFLVFAQLTSNSNLNPEPQTWIWLTAATVGGAYFLNVFNFMDGLDGLAGSEAAIAALASAVLIRHDVTSIYAWLSESSSERLPNGLQDVELSRALELTQTFSALATLLGLCCIGFLIWNWPPAKIFMGDVGSGFLGFVLAFFAITQTYYNASAIWYWLILLGVFVVDGTYTLAVRFATGQKWHQPHSLHAFQKAAKVRSHLEVTLAVIAINLLWLVPLAAYAKQNPAQGSVVACVAYLPLVLIAWRYRAGRLEHSPPGRQSVAK